MNLDLDALLLNASEAEYLRIFLDYDGTLADFAPTPDTILPDDELIALMQRMVSCPGVLPAVISGRRLAHIQKLLPIKGMLLGGTYGIEMQLPDGRQFNALDYEQVRSSIKPILAFWKELVGDSSSIYLEDKGWALALHNKMNEPPDAEPVLQRIKKMTKERMPGEDFRLSGNNRFLEIAPDKANKAEAVGWVMQNMSPSNAMVLYFGDDDKDEEAFSIILDKGGFAVRITSAPVKSLAQYRMQNSAELRAWLKRLTKMRTSQ
mgnify:CR=1 FL=1